jgi:DNA-directed RNA polymerase subunit E"
MAKKERACRICRTIYEGDKCPNCNHQEYSEDFKGKVMILDSEKSELAKNMKVAKKGTYAIKL